MRTLSAALLLLLAGCTPRIADFSIVSPDLIELDRIKVARDYQNPPKTKADALRHWVLFIPFPLTRPSLEDAVDELLKQSNGDCAVDIAIWKTSWTILLYSREGYYVEGRVLNTRQRFGPDAK